VARIRESGYRRRTTTLPSNNRLALSRERLNDVADVLRVAGELDATGVAHVEEAVQEALAARVGRLVIDLTPTTYLDSAALASLVRCSRRVRIDGGLFVVVAGRTAQPAAKIDLSGTRQFFHLCASVDEALDLLGAPGEPSADGGPEVQLRLYLNGSSSLARRAASAADELRAAYLPPRARIDIVDVHDDPDLAERDQVLATPLLVRLVPSPVRRIVGDLSPIDEVARALNLPLPGARA
jgi:circadian clock protein KaiB